MENITDQLVKFMEQKGVGSPRNYLLLGVVAGTISETYGDLF